MTIAHGTPMSIHVPKAISKPWDSRRYPFISAIGGCPIRVAVEPIVTPYATPNSSDAANFLPAAFSSMERTRFKIDTAIGTIMTAVAVFDTQAEMKAEAIIKPSTIWDGFVPTSRIVSSATRRCRLDFSVARPRMTPPMTKKITVPAYGAAISSMVPIPNSGNNTSGRSDVTGIGAASVIHQMAIHSAQPATARPSKDSESGRTSAKSNPATGPSPTSHQLRFVARSSASWGSSSEPAERSAATSDCWAVAILLLLEDKRDTEKDADRHHYW